MAAKIGDRFVALQDFESKETRSHYGKDLGYTVQTEALAKIVDQWIADGKVKIVDAGAGTHPSIVNAVGEVK